MSIAAETFSGQWFRDAACRNSAVFVGAVLESESTRREREADAKRVCRRCPVRSECLQYALRVREPLGIWGGLDALERRALAAD